MPENHPAPSVGRVVHYFAGPASRQPIAALVTAVHSETCVSLAVFPFGELGRPVTSVMHAIHANPAADRWEWPPRS